MGEHADKLKGNVKEATGTVTGDDRMRREGKLDQLSGNVKGVADDVVDKVRDLGDKAEDKVDKRT